VRIIFSTLTLRQVLTQYLVFPLSESSHPPTPLIGHSHITDATHVRIIFLTLTLRQVLTQYLVFPLSESSHPPVPLTRSFTYHGRHTCAAHHFLNSHTGAGFDAVPRFSPIRVIPPTRAPYAIIHVSPTSRNRGMPAASYWRPVTISHTVPRAECYRSSFMCWQKYSTCQQCASVAVECEMSIDQQQA